MSERELKSITFEGLGITYVIPSSGSSSGGDSEVVKEHINNKSNPHGVTAVQIGAAPSGYGYGEIKWLAANNDNDGSEFNALLETELASMENFEAKQYVITDYPHLTGTYMIGTLYRQTESYAVLYAYGYGDWTIGGGYMVKRKLDGVWQSWEYSNPPMTVGVEYRTTMRDNGKALYLRRGNNGAIFYRRNGEDAWYAMASRIDGTFANVVAANPTAQDPATRQLRNSTIVSTETNPSYNGEICWVYK